MLTLESKTTNKVLTNVIDGKTVTYRYAYNEEGQLSSAITATMPADEEGLVKTLHITSEKPNEYRINSVITGELASLNVLNGILADFAEIHADLDGVGTSEE
jgi:YD repeat-containing protein